MGIVANLFGLLLLSVFLVSPLSRTGLSGEVASRDDRDFYRFPVEFRSAAKQDTVLGRLPRPLYLYSQSNGAILAFNQAGEKVDVPFQLPETVDATHMFFDVYTDRIFYVSNGVGRIFHIGDERSTVLPDSIQQELKKEFCMSSFDFCNSAGIAAASGNVLVIGGGVSAAEDEYAAFDIRTGELLYRTQVAGYDIARIYRIFLPEETVVVTLNSKGRPQDRYGMNNEGLHRYTFGSQSEKMDIYLEHSDLSYSPLSRDIDSFSSGSFEDDWTAAVSTIGKSSVLEDKNSIYSYKSKAKNAEPLKDNLFSVRDVFLAAKGRLLLEIDDGLLIVDVKKDSAQFIDNKDEIEILLDEAILIAPDAGDYRIWGNCPYSESLNSSHRGEGGFCLT